VQNIRTGFCAVKRFGMPLLHMGKTSFKKGNISLFADTLWLGKSTINEQYYKEIFLIVENY
jgi:hypothetical protein